MADSRAAWSPDNHVLSAATYNELFTMHGTTMIFLVVMPLLLGFLGNFLIPLQIGARDVAFPRLNALSFWLALIGGHPASSRLDSGAACPTRDGSATPT